MRIIAALLLIVCLSWPGFAVQAKKHRSSHSAAAGKKPASKKPTGKKTAAKKGGRRRGATPRSMAQKTPTPERYQEIQQAMAAKGYAPQAPNGVWSPDWAAALKHYQQDQKLEATGKLNSMSLITLGLGPKRESPAGVTTPPAQPPGGAPAPPAPPATGAPAPPAQPSPGAVTPPAQPPTGAPASPAPPADQPSSSSSTVREQK